MPEKKKGRLILSNLTAAEEMIYFPIAARLRDEGKIPDTIVVNSKGKISISLAFHDDLDGLNLDAARVDGVQISRREPGAGMYWGPVGGMMASLLTTTDVFADIDEAERVWDDEIIRGSFDRLGIPKEKTWYKHPGDIKIGERKLCGTTTSVHGKAIIVGCFINRLTPATKFFSDYLIYPDEKLKDKTLKDITKYAASFETDAPRVPTEKKMAEVIAEVAEERLGMEFAWGDFTEEETSLVEKELGFYTKEENVMFASTSRWLASLPSDLVGAHRKFKSLKLLGSSVAIDSNKVIKDVLITGDFLLGKLEDWFTILDELKAANLRADDEEGIRKTVKEIFEKHNIVYSGFTLDELAQLLIDTGKDAIKKLES
jgi:lipoate-protein ligase A